MKKILILGSSGFIGRNIKEHLYGINEYKLFFPTSKELDIAVATVYGSIKQYGTEMI